MRPIPLALKQKMEKNPFMSKCAYPGCFTHPEWEHAFIYAGKQINDEWAIVPVCAFHHRGRGLDKWFNQWIAINRASFSDLSKYSKRNWFYVQDKLNYKFKDRHSIANILKFDSYTHSK